MNNKLPLYRLALLAAKFFESSSLEYADSCNEFSLLYKYPNTQWDLVKTVELIENRF